MNEKIKPALIGGIGFGIASVLPYIEMVNVVCCALYIGGGVLACYLYLKDRQPLPATAPYGDGAVVGLLAGVIGGVVAGPVGLLLTLTGLRGGAGGLEEMVAAIEQAGVEVPFLADMSSGGLGTTMILIGIAMGIVIYGISATIGGLLGVAIFFKKDST